MCSIGERKIRLLYVPRHDQERRIRIALQRLQQNAQAKQSQKESTTNENGSDVCTRINPKASG